MPVINRLVLFGLRADGAHALADPALGLRPGAGAVRSGRLRHPGSCWSAGPVPFFIVGALTWTVERRVQLAEPDDLLLGCDQLPVSPVQYAS